jgi:hypothetical protein
MIFCNITLHKPATYILGEEDRSDTWMSFKEKRSYCADFRKNTKYLVTRKLPVTKFRIVKSQSLHCICHAWETEEMCKGFWWESMKERNIWKTKADGRMGSKGTLRRLVGGGGGCVCVEWIHLAQDRN